MQKAKRGARVNNALLAGGRGLTAGSSLARLLAKHREKRNHLDLSDLTEEQILAWADTHRAQTGEWPSDDCGVVKGAPDETWCGISTALRSGSRGLAGGSSLAQLLMEHGRKRNRLDVSDLTIDQILLWADKYSCEHRCLAKGQIRCC